jgi:hypothetical protein
LIFKKPPFLRRKRVIIANHDAQNIYFQEKNAGKLIEIAQNYNIDSPPSLQEKLELDPSDPLYRQFAKIFETFRIAEDGEVPEAPRGKL